MNNCQVHIKTIESAISLLNQLNTQVDIFSLVSNVKPVDKFNIKTQKIIKDLKKLENDCTKNNIRLVLKSCIEKYKEKKMDENIELYKLEDDFLNTIDKTFATIEMLYQFLKNKDEIKEVSIIGAEHIIEETYTNLEQVKSKLKSYSDEQKEKNK